MATAFPKYPALPVQTEKLRLICAGEPRLVLEDDRVTERRSPDGRRLWKVPSMVAVSGEQGRSEIVQVTVANDQTPAVEFGERLEADGLVVFFWGMDRNGQASAGLSFRAEKLTCPTGRKPSPTQATNG